MSSTPELLDTTSEFLSLQLGERQRPLFEVPAIVAEFFPGGWDGKDVRDSAMRARRGARRQPRQYRRGGARRRDRICRRAHCRAGDRAHVATAEIDRDVAATADAVPCRPPKSGSLSTARRSPTRGCSAFRRASRSRRRCGCCSRSPPVDAASFWVVNPARAVRCVVALGSGTRRMRNAAEEAVRNDGRTAFQGRGQRCARQALASRRRRRRRPAADGQRRCCTWGRRPGCSGSRSSVSPCSAGELRGAFARGGGRTPPRWLGYDLHDGPLQDVAAARRELFLLRDELARRLGPRDEATRPGPARPARGDRAEERDPPARALPVRRVAARSWRGRSARCSRPRSPASSPPATSRPTSTFAATSTRSRLAAHRAAAHRPGGSVATPASTAAPPASASPSSASTAASAPKI